MGEIGKIMDFLWDLIKRVPHLDDWLEEVLDDMPRALMDLTSIAMDVKRRDLVLAGIPQSLKAEIAAALGMEEFSFDKLDDWRKSITAAAVIARNYPDFRQRKQVVREFIDCTDADYWFGLSKKLNPGQAMKHYTEADDPRGVLAARAMLYYMTTQDPIESIVKILKELSAEDLGKIRGFIDLADAVEGHAPTNFYLEEFEYIDDEIGALGARAVVYLRKHLHNVEPLLMVFRQLSADALDKFKAAFDSEREGAKKLLEGSIKTRI